MPRFGSLRNKKAGPFGAAAVAFFSLKFFRIRRADLPGRMFHFKQIQFRENDENSPNHQKVALAVGIRRDYEKFEVPIQKLVDLKCYARYSRESCLCSIEHKFRKTKMLKPKQLHLAFGLGSFDARPKSPIEVRPASPFFGYLPIFPSIHQTVDLGAHGPGRLWNSLYFQGSKIIKLAPTPTTNETNPPTIAPATESFRRLNETFYEGSCG